MGREHFFKKRKENKEEFEQKIIDLSRITRVTAGGKQLRFRACLVIGDKKGRVGFGVAKGKDVSMAITKAVSKAKKNIIKVNLAKETIPHQVKEKFGAARILLKPAPLGSGIIAGGAVRHVLELAGVPNIVGKILGASNKINNVKAAMNALMKLRKIEIKEKEPKK